MLGDPWASGLASSSRQAYFTAPSHVLDPSHTPTHRCHHPSAGPHSQGDICLPRRPSRASFALIGSSWGLRAPPQSPPLGWKRTIKWLPCVPRSPASSPLHMSPESQIPQASPQSTLLYAILSRQERPWNSSSKSRPRVGMARGPAAQPSLTSWAPPNLHLQRGPRQWQSVGEAHTVCRGLSLCQTPPPRCRA